jgi:molybdopterin-binding protein
VPSRSPHGAPHRCAGDRLTATLPEESHAYASGVTDYLQIGEVAKAVGVTVDTLRRWESGGRIAFERQGNRRVLERTKLPALLSSLGRPEPTFSARNHLPGVVVSIERDNIMAKVELACGDFRVVSLISREAADEMELEPGVAATAIVKATSVMVETRTRGAGPARTPDHLLG